MREQNTTALVLPAHTLKGESRQLGAEPLAKIAELIETTARFCIESHRFPDELVPEVVELRRLFNQTVELFDKATNPLDDAAAPRRGGFGRKAGRPGLRPDLIAQGREVAPRDECGEPDSNQHDVREQLRRDPDSLAGGPAAGKRSGTISRSSTT